MSNTELETTVTEALRQVFDPELGYNIVDLGLIYGVKVEDGLAHIDLTTTTRGCPATDYIRGGVESAAGSVVGIGGVDVAMVYEPPWGPECMSAAAKEHFGIDE